MSYKILLAQNKEEKDILKQHLKTTKQIKSENQKIEDKIEGMVRICLNICYFDFIKCKYSSYALIIIHAHCFAS